MYPNAKELNRTNITGEVVYATIMRYTDGSKRENHVGAGKAAEENSTKIYVKTTRFDNDLFSLSN